MTEPNVTVVGTGSLKTLYFGPVPARYDQDFCGANRSNWNPGGCTRIAGHEGEHGQPNWTGRVVAEHKTGIYRSLDIKTRDTHTAGVPVVLRTREDALALLDFLRQEIDVAFPVEEVPWNEATWPPDAREGDAVFPVSESRSAKWQPRPDTDQPVTWMSDGKARIGSVDKMLSGGV